MPYFTDQASRSVEIISPPKRIISLVPSQTELLFDLGLDESIIGITKFCTHPGHWFRTKQRVGGTKNPTLQLIHELQPDLIIGNKEENRKEDIEALAEDFPVWLSDVNNLDDALQMISAISRITSSTDKGQAIISNILQAFNELRSFVQSQSQATVDSERLRQDPNQHPLKRQGFRICYLIWQEPFIAVGNNSFIHSMLLECGFNNIFEEQSRYPTITLEEIKSADCDFIFLSSEPYPFTEKHRMEIQSKFPGSIVIVVDGELFSWYGSRLTRSAPYFQTLINKLHNAAGTR